MSDCKVEDSGANDFKTMFRIGETNFVKLEVKLIDLLVACNKALTCPYTAPTLLI